MLTFGSTPMQGTLEGVAQPVDPTNVSVMKEALGCALTDEEWRVQARRAGPERARRYTWSACVKCTAAAYRAALG